MLRPNTGIADLMEHDLQSFGVPASSIVKFSHRAANTREEAEALSGLIASRGWKRILLVTSNYHTRRALFIFERAMPAGVSVRVSGARDRSRTLVGHARGAKFIRSRIAWVRCGAMGIEAQARCIIRRCFCAALHSIFRMNINKKLYYFMLI
jgi:uncharacterized SAM-binding protein YcdF (DUF218 family)